MEECTQYKNKLLSWKIKFRSLTEWDQRMEIISEELRHHNFSTLVLCTFVLDNVFAVRGFLVHYRMFTNILGLSSLDANNPHVPTTKNLQTFLNVPEWQNALMENHWNIWIIEVQVNITVSYESQAEKKIEVRK